MFNVKHKEPVPIYSYLLFKNQKKGYQTRINALLKAYKDAHQNETGRTNA